MEHMCSDSHGNELEWKTADGPGELDNGRVPPHEQRTPCLRKWIWLLRPIDPAGRSVLATVRLHRRGPPGGVVYVGSQDNYVYALDAFTGDLVWRYETGWRVLSSPAITDGVVYVGSLDHYLYALDAATGNLLWRYKTGDTVTYEVSASPAVVGGITVSRRPPFSAPVQRRDCQLDCQMSNWGR